MLRISNATVNETGQYQCSYRDLKAEDGKTSIAAYVFVHGISQFTLILLCLVLMLCYTED